MSATTVVFNNRAMVAERDLLKLSTQKYGALTVSGNYAKVAEGLNVTSTRVEKPAAIVQTGAPFLLELATTSRTTPKAPSLFGAKSRHLACFAGSRASRATAATNHIACAQFGT
jgi:thiamine pyrophosphate-dependent acetolactate synthase large subunit-like protein